ncbi:MAG: gluconate permease [Vibrio anguillarum]|nr:gluconate permease [Vibrio ordalii]
MLKFLDIRIVIPIGVLVHNYLVCIPHWLVSRLMEMDEKTTLKTWTVMETLLGSIAFVIVAVLSFLL